MCGSIVSFCYLCKNICLEPSTLFPQEVLEAGRRAGDGSPDAEPMLAAIRARLARKSLPLVSADGLVVYGLQISPTVQIATGNNNRE